MNTENDEYIYIYIYAHVYMYVYYRKLEAGDESHIL